MQIGLAIHGSDALLFGLAFPDPLKSSSLRLHVFAHSVGSPFMATSLTNKKATQQWVAK